MSKMKKVLAACLTVACVLCLGMSLVGCSSQSNKAATSVNLEGHTLHIYCGAGMTNPFQEIADAFQQQTKCTVEVTYANAAQIQTQINTTESGDFFISGSAEELKPVEGYVKSSTDLVKHIPVLVVQKGNPLNISKIADLANCSMFLTGDPESTPIGKIAKNIMTNAGVWDSMMADGKISTTTTAPQIATALAQGEGDAGIVWKENVNNDKVQIVECEPMTKAIKVIPAALLTTCADEEAAAAFSDFLKTDTAWNIWTKYGYEKAA